MTFRPTHPWKPGNCPCSQERATGLIYTIVYKGEDGRHHSVPGSTLGEACARVLVKMGRIP